jgi:hypothetical protein
VRCCVEPGAGIEKWMVPRSKGDRLVEWESEQNQVTILDLVRRYTAALALGSSALALSLAQASVAYPLTSSIERYAKLQKCTASCSCQGLCEPSICAIQMQFAPGQCRGGVGRFFCFLVIDIHYGILTHMLMSLPLPRNIDSRN